jgi:hypothetical protein
MIEHIQQWNKPTFKVMPCSYDLKYPEYPLPCEFALVTVINCLLSNTLKIVSE